VIAKIPGVKRPRKYFFSTKKSSRKSSKKIQETWY
ncbi:unnamed protein product, partial [marine sediment metagenome]